MDRGIVARILAAARTLVAALGGAGIPRRQPAYALARRRVGWASKRRGI